MILFSAILDIEDTLTKDGFVDLVLEWNNAASRASNHIPGIEWNDSFGTRFGDKRLWLEIIEYPLCGIVAAHHEKVDESGAVWATDYVMNYIEMRMSIRLDRSYQEDALRIGADFSTPHFITHLIEGGYVKPDGCLPVLREPVFASAERLSAISLSTEGDGHILPLLFVPAKDGGGLPFDVGLLASKLKGVAHVFAEDPSQAGESGPLSSCIEIRFPSASAETIRIPVDAELGERALLGKVMEPVVQYSNSKAVDPLYTWNGVRSSLLLDKLAAQHERVSRSEREAREANELLSGFEDDLVALEDKVRDFANRIAILEAENASLRSRASASSGAPLLHLGSERDYFDGEVKDLVLSALSRSLKGVSPSTRRHDVISDVIRSNGYQGICERRADEMSQLMKDLDPTSERFESSLRKLGFETKNNRKHLKARYYGDDRYMITFSKTPSDIRAAANSAAEFVRKAF